MHAVGRMPSGGAPASASDPLLRREEIGTSGVWACGLPATVVTVSRFALERGGPVPTFLLSGRSTSTPRMSHVDPIRQRVIAVAEPVCLSAGYELVDVRFKSEPGGWVLRVFIDVLPPADAPPADLAAIPEDLVDLDDCENLSRELSAVLDVEDPV